MEELTSKTFIGEAIATGMALSDLDPQQQHAVLVPEGYSVEDLERFHAQPRRTRQQVAIHNATDFGHYVNRFKNPETTVYADLVGTRFTAVIDHPGAGGPDWGQHRATYACPHSRSWKTWSAADGKAMRQADFAKFIEDNLPDVQQPSGSDILTISRTLEAKKKVDFQSGVRLDNGEVQITFNEEIKGTAGKGTIEIPETFELGIPVFEGGDHYALTARLRYRINEGQLVMWFDLLRPERLLEDAFANTLEQIRRDIGDDVMMIHADAPIR
ncbi:MAG: YfdQ family protein [Pseudomonadota bacterium]